MFNDVTHNIKVIRRHKLRFIKRSLNEENPSLLAKECSIQLYVEHLQISPKILTSKRDYFLEEYIKSKKLKLSRQNIVKIVQALGALHGIKLTGYKGSFKLQPDTDIDYLFRLIKQSHQSTL